jgi:ribosomal-protein-alanine N-acetyltransferase
MPAKALDSFETRRLFAERLERRHLDLIRLMHLNESVMAHLGGKRSDAQTLQYMERNLAHWAEHGYGIWILRDKATGQFVGRGGLRRTVLEGTAEVEIAYGLMPQFWGQGLATEFTRAIARIAREELGLSDIVSYTLPENVASRRVMEKAGFRYERDILHNDTPHVLYRWRNR